jgi:hypothetical protein
MTNEEAAELVRSSSALLTSIPGHKLVCRRCKRDCNPWPLARSARCSPKYWVTCIAPIEDCNIVPVTPPTESKETI